jgi:hypothetical protein
MTDSSNIHNVTPTAKEARKYSLLLSDSLSFPLLL